MSLGLNGFDIEDDFGSYGSGGGSNFRKTSTSTRFVNGKKVVTKKYGETL